MYLLKGDYRDLRVRRLGFGLVRASDLRLPGLFGFRVQELGSKFA